MMMEEDNVARQRREIIEKYVVGPIKNSSDDWENPQYSIYAITDYFGFIHDSGLTKEFVDKENKIKKLDTKREKKWKKLMDSKKKRNEIGPSSTDDPFGDINSKLSNSTFREELKKRVYKGIPQKFKSTVWQSFLQIKLAKSEKPNIYKNMLEKALAKSPDIHQIDLDVNRTFRSTTYFRERYNGRQKALLNVLAAYSMYNTEIGYCQGMSEIAGLLLMYLVEEEDVFWAMSQLMTMAPWRMHGLFVAGFPRLLTYFDHLSRIMHKLLPKVAKHFEKLDVFASAYALKWFMQCYLDRVPLTLFLRLWDIYLLEGEELLIGMAYNILKMHKKRLLKMDHASILGFLQSDLKKDFMYEDDIVIESLKRCLEELKRWNLLSPPPPKPEELPMRPFGADSHFHTPSPAAIKQRQAEQSNPEAAVRKSLRNRRQSNRDTSGSNHSNHVKSITEINESQDNPPNVNEIPKNQTNDPDSHNNLQNNHVEENNHANKDEPGIAIPTDSHNKPNTRSNRPKSSIHTSNTKSPNSSNRYSYPNNHHQKPETSSTEYYTLRSQVNNVTLDANGKQKYQTQNVKYRIHHKVPKSSSLYLNNDDKANVGSITRPKSENNPTIIIRPNKLQSTRNHYKQQKQPVIRYHYNKSTPNLNANQNTVAKEYNSIQSSTANRARPKSSTSNTKHLYNTNSNNAIHPLTSDNTINSSNDSIFRNKTKNPTVTQYFPAKNHLIKRLETSDSTSKLSDKTHKDASNRNKYSNRYTSPGTVV